MADQMTRVQLLMAQRRLELAERELRRIIGEQPEYALAFAYLALCLANDEKRYQEATLAAEQAVQLEPDEPFNFYALSLVLLERNHFKEALQQIHEAIRLDPYDANFFGQQANVYFQLRRWQDALDSADAGLAIDPEHTLCGNLRTISLERLGRGGDAVESAKRGVKHDPEDSYSHAALGWALLERGQYKQAQESFREALRLQPNNSMARSGMISAINSRSLLFRLMYRWHTSLSRLARKYQFVIIFGAWLLVNALGQLGGNIPWLAPVIPFVLMAYMMFAVLTWTSDAVFNTLLRFHPFGRHLLTSNEIWCSNFVAVCIISGTVGAVYALVAGSITAAIVVVFYWMLMCVPATIPFLMPTKQRAWMAAAAGILIGLIPVYGLISASMAGMLTGFVSSLRTYNWSIIGLQVAGGFLAMAPNRK